MIIPMLKYTFLIYHKDYNSFIHNLKALGVVHIAEQKGGNTDEMRENMLFLNRIISVVRKLKKLAPEVEVSPTHGDIEQGRKIFEDVEALEQWLEQQAHRINHLKKEINELQPWGHFSLETIYSLQANGINTRLFICARRQFNDEWLTKYPIGIVNEIGGNVYFAIFQKESEEFEIIAEEVKIPHKSLNTLEQELKHIEDEIEAANKKFLQFAQSNISDVVAFQLSFMESIDQLKVEQNTLSEADDKLKIVEGWIPTDKSAELDAFLEQQNIVYLQQKPTQEDKVPILLKNNKFAEKFEVIGELYSLPKYGELDLTPFFAPFYTLFFGFCLGDAGYGILMTIAAIFFYQKVKLQLKPILTLISFLGLSTIIFGLIGGTFFGINLYESDLPVYRDLQAMLKANNTTINDVMFKLSLILGGVQIVFGMILKAVNECRMFGWRLAIGTIGWVFLIVGLVTVYLLKMAAFFTPATITTIQYVVLGIGGVMTLLINNLTRNPLINLGSGLWTAYNMVTGILGDLLSYIRLFALGISSAILGYVFNTLAVSMAGSIVGIFFMVVVLVIGHGINLFMSGLGSFVHPIRLTFVEFYKNAGFIGGGKKYKPFRKLI